MNHKLYKKMRTVLFTASLVCVSIYAMTNAAGPPAENTNAPGDNHCGQSGCHNFSPISSGTIWSNINFTSNMPASGYVPGNTYSMTLSVAHPGHSTFGFQTTIQDANGINAGTLASGGGSAAQTSNGKIYVNHTAGGTSGVGGRSWTFSWTAPSTPSGTLTMYVTTCSADGDGLATNDTIYSKGFVIYLTGTAPPTASITQDKDTICQNDTVHFTGSGQNNPTGYQWSIPGATFISGTTSTSPNPIVTFTGSFSGGSITRQISLNTSNANGMSQPAIVSVLVNALPTATTSPTGAVSICGNDSATLTAASGTGYQYLWSPGNATTQSVVVKTAGTWTVKVTNPANGCAKVSPNVVITKRTIPSITMTVSRDSICQGDTVKFTAPSGFVTYEYYRDTTKVQTGALLSYIGKPATANSYTVYGTDVNGCKSTPSNAISVYAQVPLIAPVVNCSSGGSSVINFNWNSVTLADGYEVSVDSGKTWIAPSSGATGLTHVVSGLTGGTKVTLYVRATQLSGRCSKGDIGTSNCQSGACNPINYNIGYDSIYCNPAAVDSETVVLSNIAIGSFAVKVEQVSSNGTVLSTPYPYSNKTTYRLKLNGTNTVYYKFSMIDSAQLTCPATAKTISIRGIVSPSADPVLTFGKTVNVLCDREVASFTSTKPTGTDIFAVMKNSTELNQTANSTMTYPSSTFASGDAVTVRAINSATGCYRTSNAIQLVRKVDPKAGFTFVKDTVSKQVQFNDTTTGAITWKWNFDDGGSSSIKNPSHTYTINGTYNVTLFVTTSDQCKSDTAKIAVKLNTGLVNMDALGQFRYFPNPVKSALNLDFAQLNASRIAVEITDMQGRLVKSLGTIQTAAGMTEVDMSELNRGMYMIIVKTESAQRAFPIIKE